MSTDSTRPQDMVMVALASGQEMTTREVAIACRLSDAGARLALLALARRRAVVRMGYRGPWRLADLSAVVRQEQAEQPPAGQVEQVVVRPQPASGQADRPRPWWAGQPSSRTWWAKHQARNAPRDAGRTKGDQAMPGEGQG